MLNFCGFTGLYHTEDARKTLKEVDLDKKLHIVDAEGSTPLTYLLSGTPQKATTNANEFSYYRERSPNFYGTITGIFSDTGMATAIAAGSSLSNGNTVYVKVNRENGVQVAKDAVVTLFAITSSGIDLTKRITLLVTEVSIVNDTGAGVWKWTATVLEDVASIAAPTNWQLAGRSRPEHSTTADGLGTYGELVYNYTQIFDSPYAESGTVTAIEYKYMQKRAVIMASRVMHFSEEAAALLGIRSKRIETNGKARYTTGGIISTLQQYAPENILNPMADASIPAGTSFLEYGEDILTKLAEASNLYSGDKERLVLVGNGFMKAINRLAVSGSNKFVILDSKRTEFGFNVTRFVGFPSNLSFATSGAFSRNPLFNNSALVIDGSNIRKRILRPMMDMKSTLSTDLLDGTNGRFLTEYGFEFHYPESIILVNNFGIDKP